ncbi:MAG: DNA alkylation repair protein [Bacteroidia bacterium]
MDKAKSKLISEINLAFEKNRNPSKALSMQAYMKDKFLFYGISAPDRVAICRELFKTNIPNSSSEFKLELNALWGNIEREWQYTSILYASKNKKFWTESIVQDFEDMLTTKSWWDTVDTVSSTCIVPYFRFFPEKKAELLQKWEKSNNLWLKRVCIIHQLTYKSDTDLNYLSHIIISNKHDNGFFIQKAIGWSLRQYAKTNPIWVKKFVESVDLKPLSVREALKNIK